MKRSVFRSSPMARVFVLGMLGLLAACGGDDATPTRVLLIVEADDVIRRDARSVRISAYASDGAFAPPLEESALTDRRDWEVAGESDWPIRVLLTPQRFPEGRYRIVASTEVGSMGTVQTQVISGYVAGELRVVRVRLFAACIDADPCSADQRCSAVGTCEDAEIPPEELECPDGGACSSRDAGGPDVDGGDQEDGGVDDAGNVDAGSCVRAEDCDDDAATCVDGRCVFPDAGVPDGGGVDAGPPPPTSPTLFDYSTAIPADQGVEVLGAAPRSGVVVVGSIGNTGARDALAMRFASNGTHLWTARFGGASSDRLYSVATNGSETVAVGLSRVPRGGPNNNDVLVVRVSDDGVGAPLTLGTSADQHLFGVAPGGEIADFIGFGVCGSEGSRDGLVLGLDVVEGSIEFRWARCYDLGGDEYFVGGVVIGEDVVAVGAQEPSVAAAGFAIIARVPSPTVEARTPIAFRSRELGTRAYGASLDPAAGHLLVAARLGGSGGRPTVLRLNAVDLAFRSAVVLPGSITAPTQVIPDGASLTVIGFRDTTGIYRPFVWRLGELGERFPWVEFGNVRSSPFLPTPYVQVGGVSRVVGEGSRAIVDMPFTNTPAASCAGTVMVGDPGLAPSVADELESVPITRATLGLSPLPLTSTTAFPNPVTRGECP